MRKNILLIAVIMMLVFCNLPCNAQAIDDIAMGVSFSISDDWVQESWENGITFRHVENDQERINLFYIESEKAYDLGLIQEADLKNVCDKVYADAAIAQELSEQNDAIVTVMTDSVVSGYEYVNGKQFYRYEKAYTAKSFGFETASFYKSVFVIAKNGRFYFITYHRDHKNNHFSDVAAMLESMSFENGEIKIKINDERIYPDSAPLLLEGRTLVPIRAVAEKMGYAVEWNGNESTVTLTSKDNLTVLQFKIGDSVAKKNFSKEIPLDVSALIVSDRTYLPLRAVAEAMDAVVDWNGEERTVEIWES